MTRLNCSRLAIVFLVACLSSAAFAQTQPTTEPDWMRDYEAHKRKLASDDWHEVAAAVGLSPAEIQHLQRDKLVIGGKEFKQVFTPYLGGEIPNFITADSLLNAFHVLFEESVKHLETAQSYRLPALLRTVWQGLDKVDQGVKLKPELVRDAKRHAQIIIGTALALLADDAIKPDPEIAPLIAEQVKLITEAKATSKPVWLGPPDDGFRAIDYSRFKPRGLYTDSERLQRYFRAVAWLQAIPFRVERDEELLAMGMLGTAVGRLDPNDPSTATLHAFRTLLGSGDEWDLYFAGYFFGNHPITRDNFLDERRKSARQSAVQETASRAQINDQLRFVPEDPSQPAEIVIRIFAACRTPDAVLFSRTTDPRQFQRDFASGLDVAAALGSPCARAALTGPHGEKLLATIDAAQPLLTAGDSVYERYLHCLRALFLPLEKDVPPLFSSPAWQAKSCQTALGGWAQMRHTFVLQAKENERWLCASRSCSGFVEPVPEFYNRMASVCDHAKWSLEAAGAFAPDYHEAATSLRHLADWADRTDAIHKGISVLERSPEKERMSVGWLLRLPTTEPVEDIHNPLNAELPNLRLWADELDLGHKPDAIIVRNATEFAEKFRDLESLSGVRQPALSELWWRLTNLCHRLETIAHKQLRAVDFNDDENAFIRDYGKDLAAIMFYAGNSYIKPKDDAPRVVDVCHNPRNSQSLEVGVGRARVLYLLYPWQGREVLCRGAIVPYYEFASNTRLTDEEFKTLLDSPHVPPAPQWVQSLYVPRHVEPATAPAD